MNWAIRRAQRSSPYSRRMRSSSAALDSLTTLAAVTFAAGSMRMSSGPSARKLNPRSGSSSWVLERPKSKRTRSAWGNPFALQIEPSSENDPLTSTAAGPNWASAARPASTAAGSRSIPSSRPPGVILSRIWRAWPACPRVQSIATAPVRGCSSSITSCESAGTCGLMPFDHPVSELGKATLRVGAVAVPSALGPDFHPGPRPYHHDRRRGLDPRKPALFRLEADPTLSIGLERVRKRIQRARQRPLVRSRQGAFELLCESRPEIRRIDRQHVVLAHRHVAPFRELLAKGGRDGHPPLVVHPRPMRSGEHSSGLPEAARCTLLAGAQAASAAVQLEGQRVTVLVESMIDRRRPAPIAAAGRSGVEEVYGVPYLGVGDDVCCDVCWIHHFSPLITAIRRKQ